MPEKSNLSLVTKESLIFQKITRVQDLSLLKKGRTLLSERTLRYDQRMEVSHDAEEVQMGFESSQTIPNELVLA